MKLYHRAVLVVLSLNLILGLAEPAQAAPARRYFGETGHNLDGPFLAYWQTHGGLAVFGYPLTGPFYEGGYLVQYFERNRFEYHPEYAGSDYAVLLGLLGRERLAARPAPVESPAPRSGSTIFRETGYGLAGPFLAYWQSHGGLRQFGFPLSNEFVEDGRTVQYFERARFELHPEYAGSEYQVLLGLLGYDRANRLDPALRDPENPGPTPVQLTIEGAGHAVAPLTALTVRSDATGELRVLGGDNRQYATYQVQAGVPLSILAAGAPGPQSLLLYQNGLVNAARWGVFQVAKPEVGIVTGDPVWDGLYPRVKDFLEKDAVTYDSPITRQPVRGYRSPDTPFIWLRDHVYQSKGFKFFEPQMRATLDYFRASQHPDGSFEDYFQYYAGADLYAGQIEVEADREFLFVQGVWTAWQATGDDDWLRANLDAMERGLTYTFSDPKRWDSNLGLVKRAFTIDTWDFEQDNAGGPIRRKLDAHTRYGIMHGDNTGAYQSARLLARIEHYLGRAEVAAQWDSLADALRDNLNRVSWNGQFFTHQVHLSAVEPTGVDEKSQLSLSNAYALNRGILSQNQAVALLKTYQARRAQNAGKIFAEWYSIDPPFPVGFGPPGEYVNGGVMPLVGGELARGAFEWGFEDYGLDILRRYWQLLDQSGGSYLWYLPDGRPGIGTTATLPTDGWGSAAMLNALTEGLAGVEDQGKLYQQVRLSPRWAATDRPAASVTLSYGASGAYFSYRWERTAAGLKLVWGGGQTQTVQLHLLWPSGQPAPQRLSVNGQSVAFTLSKIENSLYLDAALPGLGQLEAN